MARIIKDDIDRFFEYNIEVSTKTLYIGSLDYDEEGYETGVDFQMAEYVIKGLRILDTKDIDKPITIIMNNPGGDWYHGGAIFDSIKACKSTVEIQVYGHAMSMGSVILQAGDRRLMSPNSKMMIHNGTEGYHNTYNNFQRWAEEGKKAAKDMEDIYLEKIREKHPKFTRAKLKKMLDPDTILNPQEAIDLGLADEVI